MSHVKKRASMFEMIFSQKPTPKKEPVKRRSVFDKVNEVKEEEDIPDITQLDGIDLEMDKDIAETTPVEKEKLTTRHRDFGSLLKIFNSGSESNLGSSSTRSPTSKTSEVGKLKKSWMGKWSSRSTETTEVTREPEEKSIPAPEPKETISTKPGKLKALAQAFEKKMGLLDESKMGEAEKQHEQGKVVDENVTLRVVEKGEEVVALEKEPVLENVQENSVSKKESVLEEKPLQQKSIPKKKSTLPQNVQDTTATVFEEKHLQQKSIPQKKSTLPQNVQDTTATVFEEKHLQQKSIPQKKPTLPQNVQDTTAIVLEEKPLQQKITPENESTLPQDAQDTTALALEEEPLQRKVVPEKEPTLAQDAQNTIANHHEDVKSDSPRKPKDFANQLASMLSNSPRATEHNKSLGSQPKGEVVESVEELYHPALSRPTLPKGLRTARSSSISNSFRNGGSIIKTCSNELLDEISLMRQQEGEENHEYCFGLILLFGDENVDSDQDMLQAVDENSTRAVSERSFGSSNVEVPSTIGADNEFDSLEMSQEYYEDVSLSSWEAASLNESQQRQMMSEDKNSPISGL